ncbi:MAG: TMEM165/GDT1 family protein [Thermoplasmatota archaeon]
MELWIAMGIVFFAEFGDKTQLAVLAMATKGNALHVWVSASLAYAVLTIPSAFVGAWLGSFVPLRFVLLASAFLFLWLAARPADERVPVGATVFFLVLIAELGDKTQLTTAALAARGAPLAVGIGATIGLAANAAIAAWFGNWLQSRAPASTIQKIGQVTFVALGTFCLLGYLFADAVS